MCLILNEGKCTKRLCLHFQKPQNLFTIRAKRYNENYKWRNIIDLKTTSFNLKPQICIVIYLYMDMKLIKIVSMSMKQL